MIPKEKIEEVLARADIVQVISEYVPLKKAGRNYVGLCPFHSEKTPSFSVSAERGFFYCFGCHTGGSVITFIMKKEGLSFPDAVKGLASRYNIQIKELERKRPDPREQFYFINRLAAEYFHFVLKSREGSKAREYLKSRGYEGDIIERFSLGYAPDRWDGLVGFLRKRSVNLELAERVGVVARKERRYYDRFRGRLIFPIRDSRKRTVAFGGRTLTGSEPKYLNSPESPVFKKGSLLYGLPEAKASITEKRAAIVVEGYFDLLALHLKGFTNAVATMGTALTVEQIRGLRPYVDMVYTLFDSDEAGKKAALRGFDIFMEAGVPCRVVLLPQGSDPDELLRKEGPAPLTEAVERALPLMEFRLRELKKGLDMKDPQGKAAYLDRVLPDLARIENVAERGHYTAIVATLLGVEPSAVYKAVEAFKKKGKRSVSGTGVLARGMLPLKGTKAAERMIINVILKHPELYTENMIEVFERFSDPVLKEAAGRIADFLSEGRPIDGAALLESVEDQRAKEVIASSLVMDDDFIESPSRMLADCINRIKRAGRPRETTERFIKALEQKGLSDVASRIRERVKK